MNHYNVQFLRVRLLLLLFFLIDKDEELEDELLVLLLLLHEAASSASTAWLLPPPPPPSNRAVSVSEEDECVGDDEVLDEDDIGKNGGGIGFLVSCGVAESRRDAAASAALVVADVAMTLRLVSKQVFFSMDVTATLMSFVLKR